VVKVCGPYAPAIRATLGEAFIASSYERAFEASTGVSAPIGTPNGDVFRGPHLVAGGSPEDSRGILETKREIKELRARLTAERDALARLAEETASLERTIAEASNAIAALQAEHHRHDKAMVAHEATYSMAAEAFRDLRTNLLYAGGESPARTVMVTSPDAGDGKTALATNLAISLAQLGLGDVLLIDANWLHPSLTKQAGRSDAIGLAEVLRDGISLDRAVVRTARRGLSFLPAGQAGTESPPLGRLASVLEEAHQAFARVVIDLSPVMIAPSLVVPWANSVDQTYLVLRRAATPVALIRRAMAEVGAERAPQLILNRTRDRAGDWGPFRVG